MEIQRPAVLFAESLGGAFSRFYSGYAVDVEEAGLQVRRVGSWGYAGYDANGTED